VTLASLALFSVRSKLFPGRENTIFDPRATDDKFVIVIETEIANKSMGENAGKLMSEFGAIEIIDKEFGKVNA
jgi:hypothetical protein